MGEGRTCFGGERRGDSYSLQRLKIKSPATASMVLTKKGGYNCTAAAPLDLPLCHNNCMWKLDVWLHSDLCTFHVMGLLFQASGIVSL